jgi:protein-L-isoaspartate O-methyltransferase
MLSPPQPLAKRSELAAEKPKDSVLCVAAGTYHLTAVAARQAKERQASELESRHVLLGLKVQSLSVGKFLRINRF